jgi:hypothetical protein
MTATAEIDQAVTDALCTLAHRAARPRIWFAAASGGAGLALGGAAASLQVLGQVPESVPVIVCGALGLLSHLLVVCMQGAEDRRTFRTIAEVREREIQATCQSELVAAVCEQRLEQTRQARLSNLDIPVSLAKLGITATWQDADGTSQRLRVGSGVDAAAPPSASPPAPRRPPTHARRWTPANAVQRDDAQD